MFNSTKISAAFLAIVLVAGTITALSPSFMLGAEAQQDYRETDNRYNIYEPEPEYSTQYLEKEYNSYKPPYEKDTYETPSYGNNNYETPSYGNNNYETPSYGKDSYKSKKDSSNSVSLNKLKCINNNVNINGNNTGDINVGNSGKSGASPGTYDEGYLGVGSSGGNYGEEGYDNGYKKQKDAGFTCIINNNNNNTNIGGGGNQTNPPGPTPTTTTLNVIKRVTCEEENGGGLAPSIHILNGVSTCEEILANITPADFTITVTGNNPVPSTFPGSAAGTSVTIGAGGYTVTETQSADVTSLLASADIFSLETTFTGDCTPTGTGTIEAGVPETCTITNAFTINEEDDDLTATGLPMTAQGTADSSALEKITKLKQQWLDLLP